MPVASLVASTLLALAMLAGGVMKVRRAAPVVASLSAVGVPARTIPALGAVELAAVLGLVAGFAWWPIEAAAAAGCVLYFVGAIGQHLRVRDRAVGPAAGLLALSVATLALVLLAR